MTKKTFLFVIFSLGQLLFGKYLFANLFIILLYVLINSYLEEEKSPISVILLNYLGILISNLQIKGINLDGHGESLWFAMNLVTILINNLILIGLIYKTKSKTWICMILIFIFSVIILTVDMKYILKN